MKPAMNEGAVKVLKPHGEECYSAAELNEVATGLDAEANYWRNYGHNEDHYQKVLMLEAAAACVRACKKGGES